MKKNSISVIIPSWNSAGTIKNTIESVLSQSASPQEILVCDDGSTDATRAAVGSFGSNLVKWISDDVHSGLPAIPRNRGIAKSRGRWLAFLDADDSWSRDKLKRQLSTLEETKNLAVCTNAVRMIKNSSRGNLINWKEKQIVFKNLLRSNPIICSSMLLDRKLFDKTLGFPEEGNLVSVEDYALWLRIATLTDISFIDEPLVIYRDEPDKTVRGTIKQSDLRIKFKVMENYFAWLRNNYLLKR